jgi:hypothetical protein
MIFFFFHFLFCALDLILRPAIIFLGFWTLLTHALYRFDLRPHRDKIAITHTLFLVRFFTSHTIACIFATQIKKLLLPLTHSGAYKTGYHK